MYQSRQGGGNYWNREGMKRSIRRSFPRQVTREDPAVTAVQVDQVGKQRCLVGGPGILPEAFKRLNLRGEPKGSFSGPILQRLKIVLATIIMSERRVTDNPKIHKISFKDRFSDKFTFSWRKSISSSFRSQKRNTCKRPFMKI